MAKTESVEETEARWYAIYTKPRAEKRLHEALNKLNIRNYLPLLRIRKKWSDRFKWIDIPAFASYIFVRIDYATQSLAVRRLPQTLQFVTAGSAPAVMSDGDMELLQLAVDHFADSMVIKDTSGLNPGQKVGIKYGPFAGKDAIVERTQGKTTVILAFPALNKSIQIEIPAADIIMK